VITPRRRRDYNLPQPITVVVNWQSLLRSSSTR